MADVEMLYMITYEQGVSYTVHMDDLDFVFYKRQKLYIADMRDWETFNDSQAYVTTVRDNEARFTTLEVKRAQLAYELIANAGFSSEKEALGLANDGNITGVPVTARDIRRSYEIYGKPVSHVRGRRTAHKASATCVDRDLKADYGEMQTISTKSRT